MQKWEYLIMVRTYNARKKQFEWSDKTCKGKGGPEVLNQLGGEGWELTATPVIRESVEEEMLHYIFKRPC